MLRSRIYEDVMKVMKNCLFLVCLVLEDVTPCLHVSLCRPKAPERKCNVV